MSDRFKVLISIVKERFAYFDLVPRVRAGRIYGMIAHPRFVG